MHTFVACTACSVTYWTPCERRVVDTIRRCGACGAPALESVATSDEPPVEAVTPQRPSFDA